MAEGIFRHPVLAYLTFVLPVVLIIVELAAGLNVFVLCLTILLFAVAFGVVFLPIAGDNGSST